MKTRAMTSFFRALFASLACIAPSVCLAQLQLDTIKNIVEVKVMIHGIFDSDTSHSFRYLKSRNKRAITDLESLFLNEQKKFVLLSESDQIALKPYTSLDLILIVASKADGSVLKISLAGPDVIEISSVDKMSCYQHRGDPLRDRRLIDLLISQLTKEGNSQWLPMAKKDVEEFHGR